MKDGFTDWKHALGKKGIISSHDRCLTHVQATSAWSDYKKTVERQCSVASQLDTGRNALIEKNRHYIKSVAEALLFCSLQEIALRGHDESSSSINQGNFKALMSLIAKHDSIVRERLQHGPLNAQYTSPDIQNTLLRIMGDMVRSAVCDGVKKAGAFSLLADETKDVGKREQLSLVLRYVDDEATIHERFLTYVEVSSLTAASLTEYIKSTLLNFDLDMSCMVSQGYDGASVMSGRCSGVQARVKEFAPQAVYIHCYAHTLNLVLVDSVRNVQTASDFFALLKHCMCLYQQPKLMQYLLRNKRSGMLTNLVLVINYIDCSVCPTPDGHVVTMLLMLSVPHMAP